MSSQAVDISRKCNSELAKILFVNYCISSYVFVKQLPLFVPIKRYLYLFSLALLQKYVLKKGHDFPEEDIKFIDSILTFVGKLQIFKRGRSEITMSAESSPWSLIFPRCRILIDQEIALELLNILPAEYNLQNFWVEALKSNPGLKDFFGCTYDVIYGTETAVRLYNFSVSGSNFFSCLAKRLCTLLNDANSYLLIHQLHAHGISIALLPQRQVEIAKALGYLRSTPVYPTTGFGIGDLITSYPLIHHYVPQVLVSHYAKRKELKSLINSLWKPKLLADFSPSDP